MLSVQRNSGQILWMLYHYERLSSMTSFCHVSSAVRWGMVLPDSLGTFPTNAALGGAPNPFVLWVSPAPMAMDPLFEGSPCWSHRCSTWSLLALDPLAALDSLCSCDRSVFPEALGCPGALS